MEVNFYGNGPVSLVVLAAIQAAGHSVRQRYTDADLHPGTRFEQQVNEDAEVLLCVHGRRIVADDVLLSHPYGGINLHPFLAKYPGASPVARAIAAEEEWAEVTAHKMTATVDTGPLLARAWTPMPAILPDTTERDIYEVLYPLYEEVALRALQRVIFGARYVFPDRPLTALSHPCEW